MAENKKSFVAYSDWKETFDKLPDEVAGKLIKHIFAYVNDENPISNDYVIDAVFANIKHTLKRDLLKWEKQLLQRSDAGKKSAEQRALTKINKRSISLNETQRNSTVSVNVNDSVNVIVNDIKDKSFNFKKSLLSFVDDEDLVDDYIQMRKLKKASISKTVFNSLKMECDANYYELKDALKICIDKNWVGFKYSWVKNLETQNKENQNGQITGSKQQYKFSSERAFKTITGDN